MIGKSVIRTLYFYISGTSFVKLHTDIRPYPNLRTRFLLQYLLFIVNNIVGNVPT